MMIFELGRIILDCEKVVEGFDSGQIMLMPAVTWSTDEAESNIGHTGTLKGYSPSEKGTGSNSSHSHHTVVCSRPDVVSATAMVEDKGCKHYLG